MTKLTTSNFTQTHPHIHFSLFFPRPPTFLPFPLPCHCFSHSLRRCCLSFACRSSSSTFPGYCFDCLSHLSLFKLDKVASFLTEEGILSGFTSTFVSFCLSSSNNKVSARRRNTAIYNQNEWTHTHKLIHRRKHTPPYSEILMSKGIDRNTLA